MLTQWEVTTKNHIAFFFLEKSLRDYYGKMSDVVVYDNRKKLCPCSRKAKE